MLTVMQKKLVQSFETIAPIADDAAMRFYQREVGDDGHSEERLG